jgi:hypothetical protein
MTINTYATLKTAVTSWMDITASDLSTKIDDLVTIAENRILRECFTKDSEYSYSGTIASGVIAVPSDWIKWKFVYIDGTPVQTLEPRSAEWLYGNYGTRSSSGKPKTIARDATNFVFGPYPDSGYTVKGTYYKKAGTLSSAVYDLFSNNPDLYLFACLAESEILIGRDQRIQIWEAKYQKILNDVNLLAKSADSSGGALRVRLG